MDKRDKRSSFLNKVGDTLRIGKEKMKIKVVHSNTKICVEENSNNGGGFGEDMDTQNLTDTEVDAKFEEMLDDMNLSEEKKEPLRKKDANQKRAMLAMHVKGSSQKSLGGSSSTPHDFVKELRNPDLKGEKRFKVLESLKVSLTSNPVSWVQEFGSPGLNALLRNLTYCCAYCCDRKSEQKSTNACVRCLKAFMNNLFGLREIITHEEALTILFWTVDPSDPPTMLEAVRLLAAVCLVPPDGHEKALEGITACGEIRGQERFDPIIMGLGMRDNLPLQVACIQLVNAIVSTPDDLDFRMHLRNEFLRTGLIDLIGSLESQKGEELKTQLQIFHSHKEEDSEEFSHRYDNIRLELEYTQECFKLLLQTVTNTDSEPFFLSILQHLLSIRDDLYARPQYYKLIEECVTQIVLHRSGVDPDFRHTRRFEIDVEPLLSNLTEKSKLEESQDNNLITTKKLEEALMAKQESEARASTLEEKVKQYEQEIAQMKEKIQHGIGAVVSSSISSDGKGRAPPPPGGIPPPPPPPPGSGGPPPPPPPPPPPGCGPPPPPPPPPGCGPPPPPPPPPGGGPPPPPGLCPAPPPPGGFSPGSGNQLPFGIQPKKKYSLHTQTKRANWNKVNMKLLNEDSFWIKANEEKFESEDLFRGIEDNFCVKVKAAPENTENKSSSEEKKPTKKAKELKVLDGKAAQNLSILLGSIKVPYPEIKRRILEVDEDHLTQNLLEQLLKYMPEPEQMNQLAALKDQYHDLAEPEQFAVTLSEVKRITPKLSSILFKMKFSEIVSDIKPGLVAVIEACDQLKSSNKFAKILQLILLIGNYMNSGSRNAQTVGFEINFLTKLKNTKTQDGNMTLLHFLAKIVEEKYPDLFGFQEELSYVDKAAKASDEILQKNLKQFEKSLNQLDVDLKNASKNKTEDKFSDKMNFISVAREQYNVLNTMYKKMVSLYKNIAKYYSFDPSKYTQEEFFGDIKAFKDGFMQAMKDNAKMRETKEKIRRAKEAKEKKEREKQEKLLRKKKLVDMTTDNDQEGVMDNLLEALKTGSAFNMNRDKRDCNKRRAPRAAGAERRAQLVSTRSRQDLLDSSSREYSVKESGDSKEVSHETPKSTRRRNNPFPNTEGVDDVEELLSRLKAL